MRRKVTLGRENPLRALCVGAGASLLFISAQIFAGLDDFTLADGPTAPIVAPTGLVEILQKRKSSTPVTGNRADSALNALEANGTLTIFSDNFSD